VRWNSTPSEMLTRSVFCLANTKYWTKNAFWGIFRILQGGTGTMPAIKEVEAAKALMHEAINWSVMRWLAEKKRVRKAADRANELLDELNRQIKSAWSDELKAAYAELSANGKKTTVPVAYSGTISSEAKVFAKQVKQADDEAHWARMDAEDTFDLAEKRLSTSMAREGSRKAIDSWVLHEKAIAKARAGVDATRTASEG